MAFYPHPPKKNTLDLEGYTLKKTFYNDLKSFVKKDHMQLSRAFNLNGHLIYGLNDPTEDVNLINYKYYKENYKKGIYLDSVTDSYTANNNNIIISTDNYGPLKPDSIESLRIKDVDEYFSYNKNYLPPNYIIKNFKEGLQTENNETGYYVYNNINLSNMHHMNHGKTLDLFIDGNTLMRSKFIIWPISSIFTHTIIQCYLTFYYSIHHEYTGSLKIDLHKIQTENRELTSKPFFGIHLLDEESFKTDDRNVLNKTTSTHKILQIKLFLNESWHFFRENVFPDFIVITHDPPTQYEAYLNLIYNQNP